MPKTAIIIPCRNEAKRLVPAQFSGFLHAHPDLHIIFVDDSSTDQTAQIILQLQDANPQKVQLIRAPQHLGKGEAIRLAVQHVSKQKTFDYFGYLDADLSTSLITFSKLINKLVETNCDYIAGSRIKMMNTRIRRSEFRHLIGRIIATVIDSRYRLGIYDTQCGAKIFRLAMTPVFDKQFATSWFFDVELFLRIRKMIPQAAGIEQPLDEWTDNGSVHLSIWSFPLIVRQIYSLFHKYPAS